jgi:small basic protein (TIGR04137 family)
VSLHKSLASGSKLARQRSVFTRAERIEKLMEEGRFVEGDYVYGLPKVRTSFKVKGGKKKKKDEEDE